jgi:N-methylhydantoinase B
MTGALDSIDLEIRWRRLITIMDELDATVVRTSFSTIVGESRDFAVILVDRHGRSLAQSQLSTPAFTVTLPITCKHFLRQYPPDQLQPGDVLITNDPWLASGHLPDLTICTPVFHRGHLVAFMGCTAHISDIGGRIDYFEDRDLFEEGLRIPPAFLFRRGEPVEQLFRILEANVRVPDLVIGDVYAIVDAEALGARRLAEFLDDYGMASLDGLAEEILPRSEAAMRAAIARLPDGSYRFAMDVDGYRDPVHIAVDVRIRGGRVKVDFTGSSPERDDTSINCVLNNTFSDTYYPFKCSLLPELPNNEGLTRPISVEAPEGSIFNTRFPRAVRSRSKTSFHIHSAIYAALAQAMPQHVQAGSGSFWSLVAFGADEGGNVYRVHMLPNGGKGAVLGQDGLPTIAFPYNGTATPVEILENNAPICVRCRELIPDSGGPGRFRGGLGQRLRFTPAGTPPVNMFVRPDKLRYPAPGIAGGEAGAPGSILLNGQPAPMTTVTLGHGDILELCLPGGGGLGSPGERAATDVERDLVEGYVTPQAAEQRYGRRTAAMADSSSRSEGA